jgi:hypothetical protein
VDVLTIIKEDHVDISTRLCELLATAGVKRRRTMMEEIENLIRGHLDLEKDYLVPEVQCIGGIPDAWVDVYLANNRTLARKLKNLASLTLKPLAQQKTFESRLQGFSRAMSDHFAQEESIIMPRLRAQMRTEEREDLGQVFLDFREDADEGIGRGNVQKRASASLRA